MNDATTPENRKSKRVRILAETDLPRRDEPPPSLRDYFSCTLHLDRYHPPGPLHDGSAPSQESIRQSDR